MNIRVSNDPVTDTEELSSSDLLAGKVSDPAPNSEPTPTVIRKLTEDAPPPVDESQVATMMIDLNADRRRRTRNVLISIAFGLAVLVALLLFGRYGGSTDDTAASVAPADTVAATQGAADDVEDITIEPEEAVAVVEPAVVVEETAPVVIPEDVKADLAAAGGYDAEKCAAPKTDRAWLECASAAYTELRAEQKRLTARIETLEARPEATVAVPTWMKVLLGVLSAAVLALGLAAWWLLSVLRKEEEESAESAP